MFLYQQTFAMRDLLPGEAPVMTAQSEQVQLASFSMPVVELEQQAGPRRIPDFKELIVKMQAEVAQTDRPQRRVFSPSDLETQNSKPETYANRVSALLPIACCLLPSEVDPIYTYDLNGNRTSMVDPTGITTYSYDALNRLTSITNNKGFTTTFTYDALGRRTSMTHGNGVVTSYSYDAASQLLSLVHQLGATTVNSFSYTYDRVGNRTAKTNRDGVHNYTYDVLNRLIQATNPLPSNPLETYTYDPVGNRTNSNQNGSSIFNQANELTEDANFTYQYDANGNLTRKTAKVGGAFTNYEYDAENRLVKVVSNGTTINYKYDGLGRRVEKQVSQAAVTTVKRYIYDKEDILLEVDGSNNIVARYTHGEAIDEPLIVEKGGTSFFYHADGLGSITEITNSSGSVIQQYTYSSFGKIESQLDPAFVQPYTFTSREFDFETGLYHYRTRSMDSKIGRFLQVDPVLSPYLPTILPDYPLLNPSFNQHVWMTPRLLDTPERHPGYSYVANNPPFFTDQYGLLFGIPAGETYGEQAAQYWADLYNQTGNPFYYIPGLFASLWTPCTSNQTFLTLLGGYGARVFGPFSPRGLPRPLARLRRYGRFDPPHHGKGWHFDGDLFK